MFIKIAYYRILVLIHKTDETLSHIFRYYYVSIIRIECASIVLGRCVFSHSYSQSAKYSR